jgi:hypothetical protein
MNLFLNIHDIKSKWIIERKHFGIESFSFESSHHTIDPQPKYI